MTGNPIRQLLFGQVAGGEPDKCRDAFSVGGSELAAVQREEQFRDDQAGALVAVEERVIA